MSRKGEPNHRTPKSGLLAKERAALRAGEIFPQAPVDDLDRFFRHRIIAFDQKLDRIVDRIQRARDHDKVDIIAGRLKTDEAFVKKGYGIGGAPSDRSGLGTVGLS